MSYYQAIDPILPFKLSRQFGMEEHGIAVFFLHFSAVVVLVGAASLLVPHKTDKMYLIIPGYFILTVGAFLTGPSRLFDLSNNLSIMRIGMCLSGVGKSLVFSFS